jgi:hypothetical protein
MSLRLGRYQMALLTCAENELIILNSLGRAGDQLALPSSTGIWIVNS